MEFVNTAGKLMQQASDLKQLRKTASEQEAVQRQQADAADALADQLAAVCARPPCMLPGLATVIAACDFVLLHEQAGRACSDKVCRGHSRGAHGGDAEKQPRADAGAAGARLACMSSCVSGESVTYEDSH